MRFPRDSISNRPYSSASFDVVKHVRAQKLHQPSSEQQSKILQSSIKKTEPQASKIPKHIPRTR